MAEEQAFGPTSVKKLDLLPDPTSEVAIVPTAPATPTTLDVLLAPPPAPAQLVAENKIQSQPQQQVQVIQPSATTTPALPPTQAVQTTTLAPAQLSPMAPPQPIAPKPQYKVCQGELPYSPEVAVVLSNDKFFPSKVKLFEGQPARLIFATTNRKPAALIIERLKFQRWIAKEPKLSSPESGKFELNRELVTNRVTEVTFEPKRGSYTFHDAVSGATGEILVE